MVTAHTGSILIEYSMYSQLLAVGTGGVRPEFRILVRQYCCENEQLLLPCGDTDPPDTPIDGKTPLQPHGDRGVAEMKCMLTMWSQSQMRRSQHV